MTFGRKGLDGSAAVGGGAASFGARQFGAPQPSAPQTSPLARHLADRDDHGNGLDSLRNGAGRISHPAAPSMADSGGDDIARKRAAFLMAERARAAEERGGIGGGGISDVAASYTSPSHVSAARPTRSLPMAYLLWFIAGQISAHRFYLGAYQSAFVQFGGWALALILLISGAMVPGFIMMVIWGLWMLADVFMIHRIHRNLCRQKQDFAQAFA